MKDISRRIRKAEKQLQIGPKPELQEIIVRLTTLDEMIAEGIPQDVKDWITYRKAH